METFELSEKTTKNGRRKFKVILYEVYPDSCIDDVNQTGTKYNDNGITWIKSYCEKELSSIPGMFLKCEFLDEKRTELCGHGLTEYRIEDGLPIFENAVVVGSFTKGYIQEINTNNEKKYYCVGEGEIDSLCYNNFCNKLAEDIKNGYAPYGSVEILKKGNNDGIVYKYGYKDVGRIPTIFEHSGYALLGTIPPADSNAKILELNNKDKDKEDYKNMENKNLIENAVKTALDYEKKLQKIEAERENHNQLISKKDAEINELKKQKEDSANELSELKEKLEKSDAEINELKEKINGYESKIRLSTLKTTLSKFTEKEQKYAENEIKAFKENPFEHEICSIEAKIWEGIGKSVKEKEKKKAEQNSLENETDIFVEMNDDINDIKDINIFD